MSLNKVLIAFAAITGGLVQAQNDRIKMTPYNKFEEPACGEVDTTFFPETMFVSGTCKDITQLPNVPQSARVTHITGNNQIIFQYSPSTRDCTDLIYTKKVNFGDCFNATISWLKFEKSAQQ